MSPDSQSATIGDKVSVNLRSVKLQGLSIALFTIGVETRGEQEARASGADARIGRSDESAHLCGTRL